MQIDSQMNFIENHALSSAKFWINAKICTFDSKKVPTHDKLSARQPDNPEISAFPGKPLPPWIL
jgi:hypothetical protein